MLVITVVVLVLQIGFNAALNYRGYNKNPLIPSSRLTYYGQSRRLLDSNSYVPLGYRSDSEQSDSEDSSFEEKSFPSLRSIQSVPYQRQNSNLRYNTGTDNDVSLETVPVGRIRSDRYADAYRSPSPISRSDKNFRRPYFRQKLPYLRNGQTPKYHIKGDNYLNPEMSYDGSSNPTVSLPASGAKDDLGSLPSLIELPNLRRDQSRKYHRKGDNDLSLEESHINKLNTRSSSLSEARFLDSLLSSFEASNNRRNNRKNSRKTAYDLRLEMPATDATDNPDPYLDIISLVSSEDKPDDIHANERPQVRRTGVKNNKKYSRRYRDDSSLELSSNDRLNPDDDTTNSLSAFRGLKPRLRSRKLANNSPKVSKNNRRNYDNIGLESLWNDRMSPNDDEDDHLSVLRLDSLEDLSRKTSQLRSRDKKQQNNRHDNGRNYLRIAISQNDKLSLDEDVASNLSELLSENLDNLNLVSVSLRRSKPSNQKNSRRDNDYKIRNEEDILINQSVSKPLLRNRKPTNQYRNKNQRSSRRNNKEEGLELVLTDSLGNNSAFNLVPYHEFKHDELSSNNRKKKYEFDIASLFNDREDDKDVGLAMLSTDRLDLDNKEKTDLTVLRSTSLDNLTLESSLLSSRQETQSNQQDTTDVLHPEFQWNDQLSPDNKDISNISANRGLKSQLRNRDKENNRQNNDPKDYELKLDFPWNEQLSFDEGTAMKKPAYRTSNHPDPLYEHPYLRKLNRNRNYNRRLYEDHVNNEDVSLGLEDSQIDTESYLRLSDRNLNENLRVLSLDRDLEKGTDVRADFKEDPNSFITFPLDRRPHPRLRTQDKASRSQNLYRRSDTPLASTPISSNATERVLNAAEAIKEVKTYNDTIIFPAN